MSMLGEMASLDEATLLVGFRAFNGPSAAALFTTVLVVGILILAKVLILPTFYIMKIVRLN